MFIYECPETGQESREPETGFWKRGAGEEGLQKTAGGPGGADCAGDEEACECCCCRDLGCGEERGGKEFLVPREPGDGVYRREKLCDSRELRGPVVDIGF